MRLIAPTVVCAAVFTTLARAGTPADCGAPAAMSDGWPVSPPAQQGLDPKLICSTGSGLASLQEAAPHGVVVIRRGVLVYEQYFSGDDMRGYTPLGVVSHDANTLHNIGSITKGVVALLIGIAVARAGCARQNRDTLHVLGDGKQRKSYLHVDDCIEAMLLAFNAGDEHIEIINLGTDEVCQVVDSVGWI
jgi:hypothetical protein